MKVSLDNLQYNIIDILLYNIMIFYFQTIILMRNECYIILCTVFYIEIVQGISDIHFLNYNIFLQR